MSATLVLRILNAGRRPLPDDCDVNIVETTTRRAVVQKRGADGRKTLRVTGLTPGSVYQVQVFPVRHRPVGRFVMLAHGRNTAIEVCCPVHPDRVRPVDYPLYAALPVPLTTVLARSTLEAAPPAAARGLVDPGEQLYDSLGPLEKAGLLNIYTKMSQTAVGETVAWAYVDDVYRIRGDRIFAHVQLPFRDAVKTEVAGGAFRVVSGTLHMPPLGFELAGSFKTDDRYGNLQLTFFASVTPPLSFRVDADIDDAGGLEHAFQVLRNWLTQGDTHPYDIHQILTYHQAMTLPYELAV